MSDIEIEISEDEDEAYTDRRELLLPVVTRVVDALGGVENGQYRMGDQAIGCLRDLKTLWRKDETDDDRTVARLLWDSRVLLNDLVPILLATAGNGLVEDKRAIACADVITAMTWPIDIAEELKELDDEVDKRADFTQLQQSHIAYKAALLKPGVLQSLFGIILAPLARPEKERQERDGQIINVVLHLIRNLAFIKDPPINTHLSADQAQYSSLQSKLIKGLSESRIFQLLLTIASNTHNDPLLHSWNTLALEIFYLLFRGVQPSDLAADQAKQSTAKLHNLLSGEQKSKQDIARKASSRHSRFGTTITVSLNTNKRRPDPSNTEEPQPRSASNPSLILHRQQAINHESGSILDMSKKQATKKVKTFDELTRQDNLSVEAKIILQNVAIELLDAAFNPFLAGVLKDIRSERPKITGKDHLRLLYITKWFIHFFLLMRSKASPNNDEARWNFGLIAEVTERSWIIWVLKRMREAVEEKPKLWTELQAGIECLTQLLLLIDTMCSVEIADPTLREAAELLQHQLIYNGEILDIAFESLRTYKEGTQSLVYLDASVHLSYALLRMLERWGKGDGVYVRTKPRQKKKPADEMDEEEAVTMTPRDETITEALFSFEAFQMKFAHVDITRVLLIYLARHQEFPSPECMRRVVNLMHRQAVKSKAEGLYFKVSTLELFRSLMEKKNSFPSHQAYQDLFSLGSFILRQFFKAMEKDPFLAIEALFPKNRGHWKEFSSWEPEPKSKREHAKVDDRFPQDVQIKKGYSWSQELGIAIACLVDGDQRELVDWTISILGRVLIERKAIIDEIDHPDDTFDDPEAASEQIKKGPSMEALSKIQDYMIFYTGDKSEEHAEAATKNPHLKLLFRLCKFYILEEDAEEFEWYIPAAILLSDLESCQNVVQKYLDTPIDLDGKKANQCLGKKTRRRRRRSPTPDSDGNGEGDVSSDDEKRLRRKKKKEKKVKEEAKYKSAQFIEDSDDEYATGNEGWEAFLAQEAAQRGRVAKTATSDSVTRIGTMRATGTKKRRRKATDKDSKGPKDKKRKGDVISDAVNDASSGERSAASDHDTRGVGEEVEAEAEESEDEREIEREAPMPPRPRPRPKRLVKRIESGSEAENTPDT